MSKEDEQEEVELDEKAVATLVKKTAEAVLPEIQEGLTKTVTDAVEEAQEALLAKHLEQTEEIERKAVEKAAAEALENDPIAKGIAEKKFSEDIAKMTPAMRFFRQMKALTEENVAELRSFNRYALASQLKAKADLLKEKGYEAVQKAGYANEATAADGSVLVPDADFITTVFDNLPKYGVAFQFADVRQTDRTSVRVISLGAGLTFYNTAEAGVKTAAKLTFSKNEVTLQKYAVIVPATDELTDDAAIDFWNLVTRELTRAYAKKADEVVFTDASGISNLSGVRTVSISGAGTTITWDDLLKAQAKTEDDLDESGFRWFMRKETWYRLVQLKASGSGEYLSGGLNTATGWLANPNTPTTPWGTPVTFTRVLPTSSDVNANDGFAIYGDLSNYILFNKRGMALKMLTEATIIDQASVSTNLATQDISAMRAVVRMLGICADGQRPKFVVVGTGTVS